MRLARVRWVQGAAPLWTRNKHCFQMNPKLGLKTAHDLKSNCSFAGMRSNNPLSVVWRLERHDPDLSAALEATGDPSTHSRLDSKVRTAVPGSRRGAHGSTAFPAGARGLVRGAVPQRLPLPPVHPRPFAVGVDPCGRVDFGARGSF